MKTRHVVNRFNLIFMFVAIFATSGISHAFRNNLSLDGSTLAGVTSDEQAFILRDGVTTLLGTLDGGTISEATAVSADGSVVAGNAETGGLLHAFRWVDGSMTDLGTLGGGSWAEAVSADGAVVIGTSEPGIGGSHAFHWTAGTMTDLGTLGGLYSTARAVSADGSVVAGRSNLDNIREHAFRWVVGGTMTDLGTLGGDYSEANAMSADGSVLVGDASTDSGLRAFRWVDGTMTNLGTLGGDGDDSWAVAVSADGAVVAGYSNVVSGYEHAFRWVDGIMADLGTFGGDYSRAWAMSADGTTVVGWADTGVSAVAFRWDESTNMQSIPDWLGDDVSLDGWDLERAYGVSADGSVLVGDGFDPDGNFSNWIARKGTTPGSGDTSALIDPVEWLNTVSGARQVFHTGTQLNNLALYGSHHRPLMSYDQIGDGLGFWVTGDLGKFYDEVDLVSGSAEVGIYNDYADGQFRAGLGLGYSGQRQDLPLSGSSDLDGGYLVGEVNWRPEITANLVTSVTAIYGAWDAEVKRGYLNGSDVDHSSGNTDVQSAAIRLKVDWQDALRLGPVSFDPYAGLTLTHTSVDSYSETDGSVPAKFDTQKHDAQELRIGVAGVTSLSEVMCLRLTVEGVERFDDRGPALSGQEIGGFGISFDIPGEEIRRHWVRGGIDVDYTINGSSMIATSMNIANQGQDPDISGAISYRMKF